MESIKVRLWSTQVTITYGFRLARYSDDWGKNVD